MDKNAVERRVWQLCELFRAIDQASPGTAGAGETITVLATLGRGLCDELERYINGDLDKMIGGDHG